MLNLLAVSALALALPAALPPEVQSVVEANNQFAVDLYRQLRGTDDNLFFSPYSINKTLAMVQAGARGETEREMAAVLHFTLGRERQHRAFLDMRKLLNPNGGMQALGNAFRKNQIQLYLAARLWGQQGHGFEKGYLRLIEDCYGGTLEPTDFTAAEPTRKRINAWVEQQTHNKIRDLFPEGSLGADTRLVLASAIYFKGDWEHPFKKSGTREDNFWVTAATQVRVKMMSQTESFGYFEDQDLQGLQMPYDGKNLAMVVLLPGKKDGLGELEKGLTGEKWAAWLARFRAQEVQVSLPKFKMTAGLDLNRTLQSLGMNRAFTGDADFSGMNGGRDRLVISQVLHQAFVDVNEEGTEAAAATGVSMALGSVQQTGPRLPVFRADHPFLFAIHDVRTGVILFLGRVTRPS